MGRLHSGKESAGKFLIQASISDLPRSGIDIVFDSDMFKGLRFRIKHTKASSIVPVPRLTHASYIDDPLLVGC